ncbi:hypothetical protein KM043_010341 [Ampulex compressa]|nr:hypothetical protein KM043_010341 [Ampulex compressa]
MAAPQASSRLEMLQARFQQKQLQEKEQKLLQLYDQQQQRAYQVVQRGSAGSTDSNHGSSSSHHTVTRTSSTTHTTTSTQGGKVRQMFDERRQTTVKGIDRSYPLEPLENKTRKQAAGYGGHKNGTVTVNRQSVTVKRVARADVNSNVNGGKPVISYHEEITRQSYDPSLRHHGDEDEFGNENHVLRYANGNHPEDSRSEVQIEEILDEDTIDRGHEMGKINLLEFEENLKQRVRNDLESEEFPEHLIVDAPDRLPKRNVTKKLSQAEARLERFKNANLKRSTGLKTTTLTPSMTKKRTEPVFPAKSSLGGSQAGEGEDGQRRKDTPNVGGKPRYSKSFEETSASPASVEIRAKARNENPQFFCRESERSATSFAIESSIESSPVSLKNIIPRNEQSKFLYGGTKNSIGTNNVDKMDRRVAAEKIQEIAKGRSQSPRFFCKESEIGATTMAIEPKIARNPSPESIDSTKRKVYKDRASKRVPSSDLKGARRRNESPPFHDKESKKSVHSTSFDKRSVGPCKYATNVKKRKESPVFFCQKSPSSTSPTSSKSKRTESPSPKCSRELRRRGESPGFYNVESERSSSSMTVKPETARLDSPETARFDSPESENTARSSSPRYFCRETERSATTMSIERKSAGARSPTPEAILKRRTSSPISSSILKKNTDSESLNSTKFVSALSANSSAKVAPPRMAETGQNTIKDSEASYGTIRLDRKPKEYPDRGCAKSPKVFQSGSKKPIAKSSRSKSGNRGPSRDSELSISSETPKVRSPIKPNIALRSTGVIRDIIKNQGSKRDEASLKSLVRSRSRRPEVRIPAVEDVEKISSIEASRVECPLAGGEGIEDFETDIEVRKGSISPPRTAHKIVLPELSPKSFTSTEMDKEIQEVFVSDQYIRDKNTGSAKGTVISLRTDSKRTYSKYPKKESRDAEKLKNERLTYSLPCRKRPSLLKSNIFEGSDTIGSNRCSRDRRRDESPSGKLSGERGREKSVEKLATSKETISNTSIEVCRANISPSNEFSSRATKENEIKREIPGRLGQISSPTEPIRTESMPSTAMEMINDETRRAKQPRKIVPAVKTLTSRVSRPKHQDAASKMNRQSALRSAKLVQQTIKRVGSESGKKSGRSCGMRTISETQVDDPRSENDAGGKNWRMDEARTAVSNGAHRGERGEKAREDFGRTDSVESALRRFDSIGAESEYQDTIKPRAMDSFIAELYEESVSKFQTTLDEGASNAQNVMRTERIIKTPREMERTTSSEIFLKNLDKRRSSGAREKTRGSGFSKSRSTSNRGTDEKAILVKMTGSNNGEASRETISSARSSVFKEKFATTKDTAEMTRVDAQSVSPLCKRRLFQDKEPQEESESTDSKPKCGGASLKRRETSSATNAKTGRKEAITKPCGAHSKVTKTVRARKLSHNRNSISRTLLASPNLGKSRTMSKESNLSASDRSLSVKQLRSIEDIRKSICQEESGQTAANKRPGVNIAEESELKSAIATSAARCLSARKSERSSNFTASRNFIDSKVIFPSVSAQDTLPRSDASKKLVSETETRLHRNTKSPSPDPVPRKSLENNIRPTTRRSVPSSPCKSPDTLARRPSTDLKSQEAKSSKRLPAVRQTESINSRKATVTKSMDVVDGGVFENGLHSRERVAETKSENDSPQGKKGDAFIIDFDDRTSKEDDAPLPRKPLPRKHPVEKQTFSTPAARPVSSISSVSSGSSTQGQASGSRGKMTTRAKTPISGASPSKGLSSTKSAGSTDNLVGCKICGRRFAHDRVGLHEQICAKTVQKKRKQFDAMMYRVKGTELEPFVKKGMTKKQAESKSKKPEVKSNWRRKHEDFINAIRSAKQVQAHLAAGGKLSDLPPPPASDTSDYVQCPHCGRKFNQAAAERHIPKCEHMLHNKPAHSRVQKPRR